MEGVKISLEPYVNIKEAARFLGVCKETIKQRIGETRVGLNDFPFYQDVPHSPYRFRISELEAWRKNRVIAHRPWGQSFKLTGGLRRV